MGGDKAEIAYHGKPQAIYLVDLLVRLGTPAFISCQAGDADRWTPIPTIEDKADGYGPMGGLMAAFTRDPDSAFLVIACDYPLLREEDIRWLVAQRDPERQVTAVSLEVGKGEPLLAIWEPRAFPVLAHAFASGNFKMMDVLEKLDLKRAAPQEPQFFQQANDPKARKEAVEFLRRHPFGKD